MGVVASERLRTAGVQSTNITVLKTIKIHKRTVPTRLGI